MKITEDLGSSHAWTLHRGELDGHPVFIKRGAEFGSEAAGLRWLAEAGAVAVPEVLAVDSRTLVLTWVPTTHASAPVAERFGRELARLHASGASGFGAPWPGFIAELPMDNRAGDDWPSFYVARRVLPFVRLARDNRQLSPADVELIEEACAYIPEISGPGEPPSRIHGDLWSGNLLWSGDRVTLIDPAAHGGHRETDLAMLALFGAPHLNTILAAYHEERPLAEGWRERVPMHQLHPLLVHVCLYGEAYRGSLMSAVAHTLAL
ncbi:fructosamine kinase family protein [Streptosporangiaceae bacterium NEAU-GS5]|nr:fructosamine kinase family protein [Streptosporangiaceae bacterium NEAU-GS5]